MNKREFLKIAGFYLATISVTSVLNAADVKGSLLNGEPRRFVVHGYSTSFNWPDILQRKLDRYFDGRRVIEVVKATKGGTPISKWIDLDKNEPNEHWRQILTPAIQGSGGKPVYVLAQQSLQWVWGERTVGIAGPDDHERIEKGAAVLQIYTKQILADGAQGVFLAMHIYKKGMEPTIGNERLALAEFMKSKAESVMAGPDVWEPTSKVWPEAFRGDKVHPNTFGAEIMAHHWFKALLSHDGKEVPAWSLQEVKQAQANPSAEPERARQKPGNRKITLEHIMKRHDKNQDGVVTREEFSSSSRLFERLDTNGDGKITAEDFAKAK